jgi:phage terminase large subunit-like protein
VPHRRVAKKWRRTPADEEAVRRGYYFEQPDADHVCDFFEQFLFVAPGRPFVLEPWERDFLSRLYGWKREDGTRRYTEAYLEICKKNGKSTLLSGLCLYGMVDEPSAGVYQGAVDKEQGKIIFREAAQMVANSPPLARRFKASDHYGTILWKDGNARMVCMSSEVESKDGINASLTVFDELHRFGRDRKLYDIMEHAGAARRQPLRVNITTAGNDRQSLCWEVRQQAVRILEGATDDLHFLGVIYGADPDDDLDDPKVWRKANPSMGSILSESRFAEEWDKAKRIPGRLNSFKRLRFGIWTNSVTNWLPLDLWDAAEDPAEPCWWQDGRPVHAALDLSSVKDLTSLTFCNLDRDVLAWRSFYFVPEDTLVERCERDKVPYDRWAEAGHLIETPGNATDFEAIRKSLNDLRTLGTNIVSVGIDPWNAAHLASLLIEDGFNVVMIRQNFGNFTGPCKELERRLLNGTIAHDGNPVTRWCVENVATEEDAQGNIRPSKKKSTEKIDGVVSGVMALGLATSKIDPTPGIVVL